MNNRFLIDFILVLFCINILFSIGCGTLCGKAAIKSYPFTIKIYEKPPDGFYPADSIRIYGTPERKLKDGTIFDYINGGGLANLAHGLRQTTHMVFRDDSGDQLTVDIFDMGTRENALEAYNDDKICPTEYIPGDIGTACKAYHFEPDFLLYFHKSKYLVYLNTNNDTHQNVLESYASEILIRIPEEDD